MKLVRSWPKVIPEGRSYVVDGIDRLVMEGFDYRCLADLDDDVVLIEWDIAVGADELAVFIARAHADPQQVRVAPYILYPMSTNGKGPFYAHRIREPGCNRFVLGPDDTYCHFFGFGLIYLPRVLIVSFMEKLKAKDRFSDTTFSWWHSRHAPRELRQVPIDWDVPLVHLHYDEVEVPR